MDGSLIKREVIDFQKGSVINYSPTISEDYFEGSVEIEVFALENLVIPYPGIIVVYESKHGISMVHTYERIYSNHEIEEKRTTLPGEECCCNGIKDSEEIESFTVFHNGSRRFPEQRFHLSILNYKGQRQESTFLLPELAPYETVKIRHRDYFPELISFLDGKPGYPSYSFKLSDCFTRMLVVNRKRDGSDFQVTHSDFNLTKHVTSPLEDGKFAYMFVPRINNTYEEVVVYPDCDPGNYEVSSNSGLSAFFNESKPAIISIEGSDSEKLTFKKLNGNVPSRLHTGLKLSRSSSRLTAETCLGVYHEFTPPKHFFWGICATNSKLKSQILLQQFLWSEEETDPNSPVIIKLYSEKSNEYQQIAIEPYKLKNGKYLSELFSNVEEFLGTGFGWFTLYNPYPSCMAYSTLENDQGSICFEHTM